MISQFDSAFISFVRQHAGQSWRFDYSVFCLGDNNLLKGGLFVAVLWWFWFQSENQIRNRENVVSILLACLLAIGANQVFKTFAPFRIRPYTAHLAGIDFPYNLGIHKSSSFPSDHATLFFAFATGLFFLNRRAGIAAGIYAAAFICLPRIFLGLHYPSDILAGAAIGTGIAVLVHAIETRNKIAVPVLRLCEKYPAAFYCGFFLFSYQLATLFDDLRALGTWLGIVLRR